MPRKPRLFVPGATYHVYCRVARGELVLGDPSEAEEYIENVRENRDRDGFSVLAWCPMANHYHLVVTTGSVPLWRSMARLQEHADEIAQAGKHDDSQTFDGRKLEDDRPELEPWGARRSSSPGLGL